MKANVLTNGPVSPSRTQSYHPNHEVVPQSGSRSRSTQPEYPYDLSLDQLMASPTAHVNTTPSQNGTTRKTYGSPAALGLSEDDPFAGPENVIANNEAFTSNTTNGSKQLRSDETSRSASILTSTANSPTKGHKPTSSGAGGFRHTIQVEYDEPSSKNTRKSDEKRRERSGSQSHSTTNGQQSGVVSLMSMTKERRSSQSSTKPLPPSPIIVLFLPPQTRNPLINRLRRQRFSRQTSRRQCKHQQSRHQQKVSRTNDSNCTQLATGDSLVVNVSSPPQTTRASAQQEKDKDTGRQNSTSSTQKGHKKGKSSIDKLGLRKIFSSGHLLTITMEARRTCRATPRLRLLKVVQRLYF
jgi:protein-serine/threonine kinase